MMTVCHECSSSNELLKVEVKLPIYDELVRVNMDICPECNTAVALPHLEVEKIKKVLKARKII